MSSQRLMSERQAVHNIDCIIRRQPSLEKARSCRSLARINTLAVLLVLTLAIAGCDTTDSRYFRYGIGTDLYSTDIADATQLQDIYLTELCRQTLPILSSNQVECVNFAPAPATWSLIVQAGLNDVDRRCDAYLAWLDDRRRTNNAVLKEIGDITVASQAIMRVSGVGPNPITLAGLAFGLASDTFTNVNSRLLLEVDKTTVQTLVLRRRDEFRLDLKSVVITDRPAAVHALRLYLSICTPFAIETDINTTVTVFQQVGAGGLDNKGPLINPATIGAFKPATEIGTAPPRPQGGSVVEAFKAIILNYDPKKHTAIFVAGLARKLCLTDKDSTIASRMTAAIKIFQLTRRDLLGFAGTKVTGRLTDAEIEALNDAAKCDATRFRNYFESTIPDGVNNSGVVTILNKALAKGRELPASGASETQIRNVITGLQQTFKSQLTLKTADLAEVSGQFTPDLQSALDKSPKPTQ
ncbi:hypothetical protein [Bradyrhizobium elkanii]|uniref:Uncharacterized protein n=1 Tax=Bradyrhizobium elkanii TaxID=29448 RepID=A0A8I1YP61_BRAEL|nr:hypothetical protein [Bradyrhizobium elkanii]MBP1299778.1 hypothetical protein [Bradyrhizobium elkanii]